MGRLEPKQPTTASADGLSAGVHRSRPLANGELQGELYPSVRAVVSEAGLRSQ